LPLDGLCGPLWSALVTFSGVVEFLSSRYFLWYIWCHHQSLGAPQRFVSFFILFSLSLISLHKLLGGGKKNKERKERKRPTKTPIVTSSVSSERS